MTKIFLTSLTFLLFFMSFSQDTIVKLNGEKILSKVISISSQEVNYKKWTNLEGPFYLISKNEIRFINYQNGTVDTVNISADTNTKKVMTTPESTNVSPASSETYSDKVKKTQSKDPSFGFYFGNGFLGGQGILGPLVGIEFRLPRKNIFVRGISVGARASFTGLGEAVYERQQYTEIYGYGLTVKYYAPLPINVIQPYILTTLGGAMRNHYYAYEKIQFQNSTGWAHEVETDFTVYAGFGVGCNFMFLKHFGGFVEMGYFTTSYINLGLTLKIGPTTN